MVGVNVKTVRTYDPLQRTSKPEAKPARKPEGNRFPASFYSDVKNLAYWVTLLYLYEFDPDEIPCPRCLLPSSTAKEKSKTVTLSVLENGDYKCPECGEILPSPPNLTWRLTLTQAREELRRDGFLPTKEEADS